LHPDWYAISWLTRRYPRAGHWIRSSPPQSHVHFYTSVLCRYACNQYQVPSELLVHTLDRAVYRCRSLSREYLFPVYFHIALLLKEVLRFFKTMVIFLIHFVEG